MKILLALLVMLIVPLAAHADDDHICNSVMEGSAIAKLGQNKTVRLNIFCIDDDRIGASLFIDGSPNLSLTYSAATNGILVISQFSMSFEDRKSVSAFTTLTYIKLNLSDLKTGKLSGYLMNGNLIFPMQISGQITQPFPRTAQMNSTTVSHKEFIGVYKMKIPGLNGAQPQDAGLWVDVNDHEPFFNLKIKVPIHGGDSSPADSTRSAGAALHFLDGFHWDNKTGFSSTTAFGDTTTTGLPLWNIRGRVIDAGKIEVYLIDPINGLRGPIIATKQGDPWSYLNMGSVAVPMMQQLDLKK